jgi:hypothetical protein
MIDGGQNDSASNKTLFTSRGDLSPSSLFKEIWHREKNIIKLVLFILQCMKKYIWTRIA